MIRLSSWKRDQVTKGTAHARYIHAWLIGCLLLWWLIVCRPVSAQDSNPQPSAEATSERLGGPPPPGGMIRRGEKGIESTPLEDLLLEKGIISMDDWLRIKAEEERKSSE